MKQDEIDRALILIFKSNNAHSNCNYVFTHAVMQEYTNGHPEAQKELVTMLRRLADHIEKDYPRKPPVLN